MASNHEIHENLNPSKLNTLTVSQLAIKAFQLLRFQLDYEAQLINWPYIKLAKWLILQMNYIAVRIIKFKHTVLPILIFHH